jgi:hypothetical protein
MRHRFCAEDKPYQILVVSFDYWTGVDQYHHEDDYGREGKQLVL